jgi:hypothetical protein
LKASLAWDGRPRPQGLADRGEGLSLDPEFQDLVLVAGWCVLQVAGVPIGLGVGHRDGSRGREPGSDALVVGRERACPMGIVVEGADGRVADHERQGKAAQDAMGGRRLSE